MTVKSNILRLTIDMPKIDHKKLKTVATKAGKSMEEIILIFIENGLLIYDKDEQCSLKHTPNKKTRQAIKDSKKKSNLIKAGSVKDLLKKVA